MVLAIIIEFKRLLIPFNISFTLSLCGFSIIMWFSFVVEIMLTHNVFTILYIFHYCVLGKNQGRNLFCFFFFIFFSQAYNTKVQFESLKKLAHLEILSLERNRKIPVLEGRFYSLS